MLASHYRKKPVPRQRDFSARLTASGAEVLDPQPLAAELIGARPLTMKEIYERFTSHGEVDFRLVYDEDLDEMDFMEDQEELLEQFPNGLSPYEAAEINHNIQKAKKAKKKPAKQPDMFPATSPKEGSAERPQKAGEAESDPAPEKERE